MSIEEEVGTYADDDWDFMLEIALAEDGLVARMGRRR